MAVPTKGREALERPYRREFEASEVRRAENARMPKTLPALLEWFANGFNLEMPERIHKSGVWADHAKRYVVNAHGDVIDRGAGEGGSLIGSPDEAGSFRALMYGSPSQTDEEGSYVRPIHRAISELERSGRPLMARMLFALPASGYDWRGLAERGQWAEEMFADYLEWALRCLWHFTRGRDERQVRVA